MVRRMRILFVSLSLYISLIHEAPGATHLDPDGYWHLGVVIDLTRKQGSSFGLNRVLFEICIKEQDGTLFVRIGKAGKVESLNLEDEQLRNKFYDGLVDLAKERLANELRDFLNGTSSRKVGFITA
jgi:hypothetical protein